LGNDVLINDTYLLFCLFYYLKSVISERDVTCVSAVAAKLSSWNCGNKLIKAS